MPRFRLAKVKASFLGLIERSQQFLLLFSQIYVKEDQVKTHHNRLSRRLTCPVQQSVRRIDSPSAVKLRLTELFDETVEMVEATPNPMEEARQFSKLLNDLVFADMAAATPFNALRGAAIGEFWG